MAVTFSVNLVGGSDFQPLISGEKRTSALNLASLLKSMASGTDLGAWTVSCRTAAVAATGTVVFSGVPVNNETMVLCNTTFTAKTAAATNTEFTIGGTAAITATNLAAKINAHPTVSQFVSASANTGTVTLTALVPGVSGNAFQISEALTNATVTAFANGAETQFTLSF